ncbi:hypothetical protein F5888DRAFT_1702707 [Russula emetica]|nr:hypothetical protein F5888DRAFT_1702707 [Russula emetica]
MCQALTRPGPTLSAGSIMMIVWGLAPGDDPLATEFVSFVQISGFVAKSRRLSSLFCEQELPPPLMILLTRADGGAAIPVLDTQTIIFQ